jgi:hypothetical protein
MINFWKTFDGRVVFFNDISHQHLSNIYWYVNLVLPAIYPEDIKDDIAKALETKFSGKVLPYEPHPGFKEERQQLLNLGYLKPDNLIVVNNQVIGRYYATLEGR